MTALLPIIQISDKGIPAAAKPSIYGAGLLTEQEDSPHLNIDKIKGEVYFACAEIDQYAPKEIIDKFDKCLLDSGINYRLECYPNTQHGFALRLCGSAGEQKDDAVAA